MVHGSPPVGGAGDPEPAILVLVTTGSAPTVSRLRPTGEAIRPVARLPVGIVAGAVGVAQLVLATLDGRWFDEVLMLAVGRHHLDWGSADQPPVGPALAALADALAPDQQWVMRLPVVLATVGAVLLTAAIARELGGDARAQTLAALAQATGVWASFFGHWLTPYSLEPVQWLAIGWLLVRWVRTREDRLLPVLGVVVGVAAQTKFQVLLLCAVLMVCVAVLGPRALLGRRRLWGGAGIAALIAAPTLIWQAANGWPQIAMGPIVAGEADALYGGRAGVAVQMAVGAGLLGLVLGGYGLVRLLRAPELREMRFLGAGTVVLVVFFVVTAGRPYYVAGLYGLLAAVGAVGLQRRREAGGTRWRWVAWPASAVSVGLAAVLLHSSVLAASPVLPERVAEGTASAYRALPAPERERTAIVGGSYIYAAYVDVYSRRFGLPQAYSLNRSYGYFAPPPEGQDAVLYVGNDPTALRGAFTGAREVARISGEGVAGLAGEDTGTAVWSLTGRTEPWSVLWPRLRHLDVS